MVELNVDVKGELESAYVEAPFDEGKDALEREGFRIISLEENARLRILEGKDSFIFKYGNWTSAAVVSAQKKGRFLTKNSPVMQNPKKATDGHRANKEFYLTNEWLEYALADSVELSGKDIPTDRFADDKVTVYAFGDIAGQYGRFLRDAGIKEMPIWLDDMRDSPFARQLWFRAFDCRSGLSGDDCQVLCGSYSVRGVKLSAQGTAKISKDLSSLCGVNHDRS